MLTSLRKFTLQKEGYTARKEGTSCPYEERSDEWHHWRTGWLMHRYVEEEPHTQHPGQRGPLHPTGG